MRIQFLISLAQLRSVIPLVVIAALAPIAGIGQERRQPKQFQPPAAQSSHEYATPGVVVSPDKAYRIGASDVIEIEVVDAPEMSRAFRVNADGTILLPYIGNLQAENKTAQELAKVISDGLNGDYFVDPKVTVSVKQINSRTFFVQGAVQRPGVYQIEGQPSLLELVTIAGGLSESYGATAFIIRKVKQPNKAELGATTVTNQESGTGSANPGNRQDGFSAPAGPVAPDPGKAAQYDLIKANINGLLRGNFEQNLIIEPGDIVHIPPTDVFFVAGEVYAPGSFPLKEGTTLRQAISLAQGTTFEAARNRGVIFRDDPVSGKRQEINVDVKDVMSGKKEDIAIRANDIIIIPNSRLKSVSSALLKVFGYSAARMPGR
jgi:polysaccharide export outer membrane protein